MSNFFHLRIEFLYLQGTVLQYNTQNGCCVMFIKNAASISFSSGFYEANREEINQRNFRDFNLIGDYFYQIQASNELAKEFVFLWYKVRKFTLFCWDGYYLLFVC